MAGVRVPLHSGSSCPRHAPGRDTAAHRAASAQPARGRPGGRRRGAALSADGRSTPRRRAQKRPRHRRAATAGASLPAVDDDPRWTRSRRCSTSSTAPESRGAGSPARRRRARAPRRPSRARIPLAASSGARFAAKSSSTTARPTTSVRWSSATGPSACIPPLLDSDLVRHGRRRRDRPPRWRRGAARGVATRGRSERPRRTSLLEPAGDRRVETRNRARDRAPTRAARARALPRPRPSPNRGSLSRLSLGRRVAARDRPVALSTAAQHRTGRASTSASRPGAARGARGCSARRASLRCARRGDGSRAPQSAASSSTVSSTRWSFRCRGRERAFRGSRSIR